MTNFLSKPTGHSLLTYKANLRVLSTLCASLETAFLLTACKAGSAAIANVLKSHVKKARI